MTIDLGDWLRVLLLPAPLLIVPMALRFVPDDVPLGRLACRLVPVGGVCAGLGLVLPVGWMAAAACAPWLLATVLIALAGAFRLAGRAAAAAEELSIDVGFVYLPVGAAWLLASRAGMTVLGFSEPFVLLTALHFHYAGFAVPVITGLTGRALRDPRGRLPRGFAGLIGLVTVAPLFTALGITFSLVVERIAAISLALGLAGVSLMLLLRVVPKAPRAARPWLVVCGMTPLVTMSLAVGYALRGLLPLAPSLVTMAAVHGVGNVFGFALCGLLGFLRCRL